jgi:hypothetical protein
LAPIANPRIIRRRALVLPSAIAPDSNPHLVIAGLDPAIH